VATKREVERKLHELIERLDGAEDGVRGSLARTLPEPRVLVVTVPDLGASYWTELAGGKMSGLHEGTPRRHEIRVRASSQDLIDVVDGRVSLFSSYVQGKVKIEASLTDLLRLRKLT
jgi:SCP-2 sterol transfer family